MGALGSLLIEIITLEFFIPAWYEKGHLIQDPTRIYYTVDAITDNFSSEVVASNVV